MAKTIDLTGDDDIPPNKQSIDIDSDAEGDEELKLAIALSLQDQHTHLDATSKAQDVSNNVELLKVIATSRAGFMGLDRRAMEAERLARLKRKRGSDGEPQVSASNAGQALSPSSRALSPPPLRGQRLSPVPPAISYTRNLSTTKKPQSSSESNPFSFSEARVLLTSHPSRHTSSGLSGVSLRDLTAPPVPNLKLKSTLLSSFIADFDWLLPHFDTRLTSFVFVLHAETPQHRQLLQQDFAGVRNVRLVMPKCVGDMGKLHSKVMLLFFKSETVTGADDQADELCRLVIPSANLTPTDWGVGGVMENILFVVDLPTKQPGRGMFTGAKNETQFESDLKRQLQAMEVPEDVLRKLDIFDFTATRKIGFVHSMSQSQALRTPTPSSSQQSDKQNFFTTAANSLSSALTTDTTTDTQGGPAALSDPARTGLLSLSDTITSLGLSISSKDSSWPPKLDFIASSLGNLTLPFVRQLYSAVCGTLDPSTIAPTTSTRSKKTKSTTTSGYADTLDDETIKSNLRIYFPTSETVRNSKGGPMCGGTICFQKGWWETNELIRECLYDCVGNRGDGVLMHSKVLYVRFKEPKIVDVEGGKREAYAGWAYVGSANLSESAWGRLNTNSKSGQPKMTCRNWESGIVIPVLCRSLQPLLPGQLVDQRKKGRSTNGGLRSGGVRPDVTDQDQPGTGRLDLKAKSTTNTLDAQSRRPEIRDASERATSLEEQYRQGCSADVGMQESRPDLTKLSLDGVFASRVAVPIQPRVCRHVDAGKEPWFFKD